MQAVPAQDGSTSGKSARVLDHAKFFALGPLLRGQSRIWNVPNLTS
jgi:hypothetical protein